MSLARQNISDTPNNPVNLNTFVGRAATNHAPKLLRKPKFSFRETMADASSNKGR